MATGKPKRSPEEIEDILIQRIFLVTLKDHDNKQVMYLEEMAAGNLREGKSLLLHRGLMEAVLVERLAGGEPLRFQYLAGCYGRAFEEGTKITNNMKDVNLQSSLMNGVINHAKNLVVQYSRMCLNNPDMFPDSEPISAGSALLPLIFSVENTLCGKEFFDEFFNADYDTMAPIFNDLYFSLNNEIRKVNEPPYGDFVQPLRALRRLVEFPNGAKALVNHPLWFPESAHVNGCMIEKETMLGSFFHISALPEVNLIDPEDPFIPYTSTSHPPPDMSLMHNLYNELKDVLSYLLRNNDTRESMLKYIGDVVDKNSARVHMHVDTTICSSSGMFFNLSVLMLRFCEPFLKNLTKRDKIDAKYVSNGTRMDLKSLTTLHASPEESGAWANLNNLKYWNQFSFTCECFFMTARVLNLGLLKVISEYENVTRNLRRWEDFLRSLQKLPPTSEFAPDAMARANQFIDQRSLEKLSYESQLLESNNIQNALSFYRLMIVWLVDFVGGFKMPLPTSCPMEFACMPEHFVDDAMELLIFASEKLPDQQLDRTLLNDFLNFIIMFIASPNHIRNPYLREKMVKVLNLWAFSPSHIRTLSPFHGYQLALGQFLAESMLKLYVDIECTGSHAQFGAKFYIRHEIAQFLKYLWGEPNHRDAWVKFSKQEEKGVYLNFVNFLVNDSIYLLDESFNKIRELKEMENEGTHDTHEFRSLEGLVRDCIQLGLDDISMLAYTSEQITAPFLLPQMVDRIAAMLNYFLVQLVGPTRKSLNLKNKDMYGFEPRLLLKKIISIYVHIAREDKENTFVAAIGNDGRSYKDQLFTDVLNILRTPRIGEEMNMMELGEFSNLQAKVKLAATEAIDAETALGEIPEEFLDPIQCTLMKDPVILPSSKVTVDRSVIERHLLSDTIDPFNRSHLTQDMLVPDVKLKSQIDEFIKSRNQRTLST